MNHDKSDIDLFRRKIYDLFFSGADPHYLLKMIRKRIRLAVISGNDDLVIQLRLLMGELYLKSRKSISAGKQFRWVLKQSSYTVDALIGIAKSYEASRHPGRADDWLKKAYQIAKENQDYAGQLQSLDQLATYAVQRKDMNEVATILQTMCVLLDNAPRMKHSYLSTAWWLIADKKGTYSIPYLECYIKHVLKHGHVRSSVIRYAVQAYQQLGVTEQQIRELLMKLAIYATDEHVFEMYRESIESALKA
ncbi:MAG: hypothetical protein ABFD64_07710 [Armatimonadota bacterium]